MEVHVFIQNIFTVSKSVPKILQSSSRAVFSVETMKSHNPENILFNPSQHCSQSPVNNPIKVSRIPRMTSVTELNTSQIYENVFSKIGAR